MELNARLSKSLKEIFITRPTDDGPVEVELKEAKRIWNDGDVTSYNLCFGRLAGYDFDTQKLIAFYMEIRKQQSD